MDEYCKILIRKIFHDGINYISPVKEIIKIKYGNDNEITPYIIYNLFFATELLKNSRLIALLTNNIQENEFFSSKQEINIKSLLNEILNSLKETFEFECSVNVLENLLFNINKTLFSTLVENLVSNCIRFGKKTEIYTEENFLIIKNFHNETFKIKNIFELPVKNDRFGSSGSGLGLKVVKLIVEKLNIPFFYEISENEIVVKILLKSNE